MLREEMKKGTELGKLAKQYIEEHYMDPEISVEKLCAVRPRTLGQAGRISGVTPAALTCLEIHLKKRSLLG